MYLTLWYILLYTFVVASIISKNSKSSVNKSRHMFRNEHVSKTFLIFSSLYLCNSKKYLYYTVLQTSIIFY